MLLLILAVGAFLGLGHGLDLDLDASEDFRESLHINRLDEAHFGVRFEFQFRKSASSGKSHFESFPKPIGQAMSSNISDFRMTMTRGNWKWGSETLWPSVEAGSPGVEIWADIRDPEHNWTPLVRSLAGLTCASLDTLHQAYGVIDKIVFAHMSSETVCTENLANWMKLLPCRNRAGIAALINTKQVLESEYYALSYVVRSASYGTELILSLSLVLPVKDSLAHLFSTKPTLSQEQHCRVSAESIILVENSNTDLNYSVAPSSVTDFYQLFQLPLASEQTKDIKGLSKISRRQETCFQSRKWLSNVDEMRGTISVALYNNDREKDLTVRHIEIIPSLLRPKIGSLDIMIGSRHASHEERVKLVKRVNITQLRGPASTIEFDLLLPRGGVRVLISYSFDKAFLFVNEFPPNPNQGFDVPAAISMYQRPHEPFPVGAGTPGVLRRAYSGIVRRATNPLLVTLAHPDFSMPFNVITLSSTLFALFLGLIINFSIRRRGDRWVKQQEHVLKKMLRRCRGKPKED